MSTLYLGTDPQALAARLARALDASPGDLFESSTVIVPNRFVRKWLRLELARRLGVVINVRFPLLDDALWPLLRELDPRPHRNEPEPLDASTQRLLVLAALLEARDPALLPLQRYLRLDAGLPSRLTCRRAWQLADRLGELLEEYEQHRPDQLIERWRQNEPGLVTTGAFHQMMERAQRVLDTALTHESDGSLARLRRADQHLRSLPGYARDVMALGEIRASTRRRPVHVFGLTQVSAFQAHILTWLGRHIDLQIYHANPCASRLRGTLTARHVGAVADALRDHAADEDGGDPGRTLLRIWGQAHFESLSLLAELLHGDHYAAAVLPETPRPAAPRGRRSTTVLARLQDQVLARPRTGAARLPQDPSLQIVGCPGMAREVETVYNSILHNLDAAPQLRQTDVAVLVTDMTRYRPVIQAVFERPPLRLQYNLVDFSAAGSSAFGQALLGMLELALESFTRARVFQVLLNPCFLTRLRLERGQAAAWLEWAEALGIYQGWDAAEKQAQGYADSPLYAWRLGLQRLRLGRYMDVVADGQGSAPRFGNVVPFADLASGDREQLDAFCRAVEGLLPTLTRLRNLVASGQRWGNLLTRLTQEFLDIPPDRPEEAQVRDSLTAAFERLAHWDQAASADLSLPLVREYVNAQLEKLEGSRGDYLVGGVTVAALQPLRVVPFALIYVLGLGEDLFPGSNALSSFDLRNSARVSGDVRPAEQGRSQFLEAILSARQKLYLLYNNRELQRDQPLLPAVPLQQLATFLGEHVTKAAFEEVTMPLHGGDDAFFLADRQPEHQDVLVQFRDADRYLAFRAAERTQRWQPDLTQQAELADRRQELDVDFSLPAEPPPEQPTEPTVGVHHLTRFLRLPAQESLRRHLQVDEEFERQLEDDEPLVTPRDAGNRLVRQTLERLIAGAGRDGIEAALAGWSAAFEEIYADARLRCKVPEEAFGEIDQATLRSELSERIHGAGDLETFLRARASAKFCGPLLLGESIQPIGAKLRFPALRLPTADVTDPAIRVVGSTPFAWASGRAFEVLVLTSKSAADKRQLDSAMLEPVLLYLALLANAEPNHRGKSSQTWLAPCDFHVHVACTSGVRTWSYPTGTVTPAEAQAYLLDLTRALLDPTSFDLLPLELILDKGLQQAYDAGGCRMSAEDYVQALEERLEDAREGGGFRFSVPTFVDMIHAIVPHDALAKVQRRFGLLDRGPARARAEQPIRRGGGKA